MQFHGDVGFVMDVSGSVKNHWETEEAFVNRVAERINISPDGGHASVSLFSSEGKYWSVEKGKWAKNMNPHAELKIKFSDYMVFSNPDAPMNSFEEGVNALPYWGGQTRIDKALEVARKDMFQESNGMRPDAPKTLVFITDGVQTSCYNNLWEKSTTRPKPCMDIEPFLAYFREQKIRLIAIGVGGVDKAALLKLVEDPSDFHLAEDFNVLLSDSFIKSVTVCNEVND